MPTIIMLLAVFAIFYFMMLRPQIKKQKEQDNFLGELKKGDIIVTGSGIIGRITKLEDKIIELQIDSKSYLKVLKSAVSKEATMALGKDTSAIVF